MIGYKFMGNVPNPDINEFYRNQRVDCFITTSSSEGLPVSVMEAAGAGIPVIATDVGGMDEIIEGNGILLPEDTNAGQVADAIVRMVTMDEKAEESMRKCSRDIWESRFNATENAKKFSSFLKSLLSNDSTVSDTAPRVILITDGYPFGGEQSFVEPELREILKCFDVDVIGLLSEEKYKEKHKLAAEYINRLKVDQPDTLHSVNVIWSDSTWRLHRYLKSFIRYFFDGSVRSERSAVMHSGQKVLLRLWESMKYYARAEDFYNSTLKKVLDDAEPANTIVYSYWHRYPTLGACLNKYRYAGLKVITREHRYDLYDDATGKSMRQPFREVMDPLLDRIIFPSKKGVEYYLQRNHTDNSNGKYHVFYLGSASYGVNDGPGTKNEPERDDTYRIVSCSSLIGRKRVDMIISALKLADERLKDKYIEWIHFGDGPLMSELSSLAKETFL